MADAPEIAVLRTDAEPDLQAEYQAAVMACVLAGRVLAQHDIPQLLRDIERAHAIGPIMDPTLYREKHEAMDQDRELLEAAQVLRGAVIKLQARAAALAEGNG